MLGETMSDGATQHGPAAAGETSAALQSSLSADCELECVTSMPPVMLTGVCVIAECI